MINLYAYVYMGFSCVYGEIVLFKDIPAVGGKFSSGQGMFTAILRAFFHIETALESAGRSSKAFKR